MSVGDLPFHLHWPELRTYASGPVDRSTAAPDRDVGCGLVQSKLPFEMTSLTCAKSSFLQNHAAGNFRHLSF